MRIVIQPEDGDTIEPRTFTGVREFVLAGSSMSKALPVLTPFEHIHRIRGRAADLAGMVEAAKVRLTLWAGEDHAATD